MTATGDAGHQDARIVALEDRLAATIEASAGSSASSRRGCGRSSGARRGSPAPAAPVGSERTARLGDPVGRRRPGRPGAAPCEGTLRTKAPRGGEAGRRPARHRRRAPVSSLGDLIGGRVLAWVGGAATLLGIALFLALAISHGWIGEEARVLLAGAVSLALLGCRTWLHDRRGRTEAAVAMVGARWPGCSRRSSWRAPSTS